jgi:hypothetical protein
VAGRCGRSWWSASRWPPPSRASGTANGPGEAAEQRARCSTGFGVAVIRSRSLFVASRAVRSLPLERYAAPAFEVQPPWGRPPVAGGDHWVNGARLRGVTSPARRNEAAGGVSRASRGGFSTSSRRSW